MIPHVNGYKAEDDDDIPFAVENIKNIRWYDRILLNRSLRVIIVLIAVTVVTPLLVYQYILFPTLELPPSDGFSTGSCLVPRDARLPCGMEAVTPEQCHPQCCYDHNSNLCFHRYPSRFSYLFRGVWSEEVFLNPRLPTIPYRSQSSVRNLRLSIDEVTATHLTLTFYHSNNVTGRRLDKKKYVYTVTEPELNVIVNSTQGNIFNTARGPLIASNNIWEITFKLTNETMYGLGEIPLKPDTAKVIYSHKGGLNSIPLIFAKSNGSYHGLLIETIAPTEVIVRRDNQLVVRSITTLGLKFHLFVGPKPVDVMKDAMVAIGVKKSLEYWMLGAHICSEATWTDPLANLTTFISTSTTQRMPFESHCGTIPIVFNTECNGTIVNLVDQGATQIRDAGKKFVPHVSPYIKYTESLEQEDEEDDETETETKSNQSCFDHEKYDLYNIRDPESTHLYKGVVNEHDVIYPNYADVSEMFMKSLWQYNTNFDAVILENNWPLDESEKKVDEISNYLPYFNETFEAAFNSTPQWNATRPSQPVSNDTLPSNSTELPSEKYLYRHNEYGNQFATAFEKIKGSIPMLSTSQWMNGNVFINRQSIPTSWSSLQRELIEASLGGISGHWYWSTPICGDTVDFHNTTQIRLCAKWYMAATYMPMIKIHSKVVPRDPLAFVGTDRTHMITALNRRMSLLPYFYTVLQEGPLLRPMFYQYPSSVNITDLTSQFAVGDDLLIVPNLQPSQSHVHVWMPPGTWYEFWSGMEVVGNEGEAVTMTTTEADFLSLVRGGSIIVTQKTVQLTADLTRLQSPYSLIVALQCETTNSTETIIETSTTEYKTTTEEDDHNSSTKGTTPTDEENTNTGTTDAVLTNTTEDKDEDIKTITKATEQTITTCNATGKLYMNDHITIIFQANATALKITASGEDFQVFCDEDVAKWSRTINEIAIYGLHKDENNYDDKIIVSTTIDLCQLQNNDEIVYQFVD